MEQNNQQLIRNENMENSQPSVTVIIPVYNAEKSLRKCIDSVLNQTLQDLELLLIDDGSKDNSGKICDEYAASDSRVRVIHKPNGGVAAARMEGIRNAAGVYSIQMDSDDYAETDMLENLYSEAVRTNADIVMCDFYYDYAYRNKLRRRYQCPDALDSDSLVAYLLKYRGMSPSLFNKLVRHECYRRYSISIPEEIKSYGEDFFVCLSLVSKSDIRVAYIPKAYYHYMQDVNASSLTRSYKREDFTRESKLKEYACKIMQGHKLYALTEQRMTYNLVRRAFNGGIFSSKEFRRLTYDYRNSILHNHHIAWHRRYRLYFSCLGLYRVMYVYKAIAKALKRKKTS